MNTNIFFRFKSFLENINVQRDRMLFVFIKKYWPEWLLPNHLTILRLILSLLMVYLLFSGFQNIIWLAIIFIVASLLDMLDGSVARALHKETKIGAVLDSASDKILILPIVFFILIKSNNWWLLFFLIVPEFFNGGAILYYGAKGIRLKANIFGKTKMVVECIAFAFIFFFNFPAAPSLFPLILLYLGAILLVMDVIIKVIEGKNILSQKTAEKTY